MWKFTQRAFTGGRLDAELMGRQDLAQYYKGASELKNLVVRRQGHLSKRRGTDFVCDLDGLLGYTIEGETGESVWNSIRECRLIPLVHERDKGYYILMTAGRAFLCSRDGVLLMDGTWARKVDDYELAEYAGEGEVEGEGDKRPFYAAVPYSDDEIAELDFCQSGDTVFLAHKNHPPAKILFTGTALKYSKIDFSSQKWHSPRILSVTPSGTWGSTSSTKTISYVATYVKDGVESMPSAEFQVSYKLPWGDTCRMEIKVDKGNNETEPDYYNIYKKDASEFGLLATADTASVILAYPTLKSGTKLGSFTGEVQIVGSSLKESTTGDVSALLNRSEYSAPPDSRDEIAIGTAKGTHVRYGASMTLDFGGSYGKVISGVQILSDYIVLAHYSIVNPQTRIYRVGYYIGISSPRFKFTMGYGEIGSSETKEVSVSINSAVPTSVKYKGEASTIGSGSISVSPSATNTWSYGGQYAAPVDIQLSHYRKIEASFTEALSAAGYTKGGSKRIETRYIKIEAFTDETEKAAGVMCLDGISFESNWGSTDTFQDDYITPDLTVTPPQDGGHFTTSGDFPACVGIYKQRLAFASTKNDPFMFWLSCVGDLYNFSTHASIREDDAISATLAATEFPQINHIIVNRDLMLLADSGEWRVAPVSGNTLSYKTVSADMQSAIGCAKGLKPIPVGDEIVFVKRTGETLLATRYNFTSDGYESMDLSVLSQWIFRNNAIVQMAYRQHPDSAIECVLADGTLASLVYMKEHEVCAWSRHELGGGWKATGIATSKAMSRGSTEVMLAVERGGRRELWAMRDDVPVRTSSPAAADHLCMDGMQELEDESKSTVEGEGAVVVQVAGKRYAGYLYKAEFATVRPEPQGGETIQFEVKNAKDAEVRVLDSGDFRVRAYGVPEDMATEIETGAKTLEDGSIALSTGDFRQTLAGCNNGDGRVVVESETPFPLNILSISVNYEIQPLSGSAG